MYVRTRRLSRVDFVGGHASCARGLSFFVVIARLDVVVVVVVVDVGVGVGVGVRVVVFWCCS